MEYLLENPLMILAALAVGTVLYKTITWIANVNSDREKFHEFMNEVRDDIKKILGRLPSASISSGSPIQLTDLGREISTKLGAREWAEKAAAKLGERVKGKQPYEVQEISFNYVKEEFSPTNELETKIGMCAYESGIDRDGVLDVLAVELRDTLLGKT